MMFLRVHILMLAPPAVALALRDLGEDSEDELEKELLQVDLDKMDYDFTIYKRRFKQCETEINHFIKIIKLTPAKNSCKNDVYISKNCFCSRFSGFITHK